MKTLIFFEKTADKNLIQKFFSQSEDACFIALSPEAGYELEKEGIVHKTPSAYVSHDDLKELHHLAEEKLNELMGYLDKKVKDYDGRFKKNNLTPFFNNAYKFKVFFDNLRIKTFELNKILKEENADRVVYCSHITQPIDDTLLVNSRESIYGQILAHSAFRGGYGNPEWVELSGRETKRNFFKVEKALMQVKALAKENLLRILKHISNRRINTTKNKILISTDKNFKYILPRLIKSGIEPVVINRWKIERMGSCTFRKSSYWQEFMHFVEEDSEIHRLCSFQGCDLFDLLKERFSFFVRSLEVYYRLYTYFINFLKKEEIHLVLQETYSPHIIGNAPLVDAVKRLNIPKACWIHGGSCSFGPGWPFIDYRFTDYYLVYGNKMKEPLDKYYRDYRMDVRVAGCPYIENLNGKFSREEEKKQIVYAVRDYLNNGHYLGWEAIEPEYRDDRLWDINRKTLDCLRKFQDKYDVILKLLPGVSKNSLFKRYLKDKGLNKVKIIEGEKKIYQLVSGTDLFIFDFISTGFFEASIGEGEIFVYTKANYSEDIREIIKTRAYLYDDLDKFLNELDSYLEKGSFRRSSHSPAFIEQYLNIKKGEDNIATAVNRIAEITNEQYARQ